MVLGLFLSRADKRCISLVQVSTHAHYRTSSSQISCITFKIHYLITELEKQRDKSQSSFVERSFTKARAEYYAENKAFLS